MSPLTNLHLNMLFLNMEHVHSYPLELFWLVLVICQETLQFLIIGHLKVVFSGMALRMAVLITHPGVTEFQAEILQHLFSREPIQLIWLNHFLFVGQPWAQQFVFSEISLWNGLSWNVVHASSTRWFIINVVYLMTFEQHHQAENSSYVRFLTKYQQN